MKVFIILLIVLAVVLIGLKVFQKNRENSSYSEKGLQLSNEHKIEQTKDSSDNLQIRFEMIPKTEEINEKSLMEIKDSNVIAHINNLVPEILKTGNTTNNAIQGILQDSYQVIIPAGVTLSQSKEMTGAVRGIYHGADGIMGHANFVSVNNTANIVTNTFASAMGVASMVVGQYYMTQINAELTKISNGLSRISKFLDNEYKSKVFALLTQIKKTALFQSEILDNNELRANELASLNIWEHQCIELLGQANLTISNFSDKKNIDFSEYEKELSELHNWYIYQKSLIDLLYKIADLKHTFHLGYVSREQCGALLPIYSKQVKDTALKLTNWHQFQSKRLGINIELNTRKRVGFDGIVHKLPGLINKNFKNRPISDQLSDIIASQVNDCDTIRKTETADLFREDVRLIAKEGKLYYLPNQDTN